MEQSEVKVGKNNGVGTVEEIFDETDIISGMVLETTYLSRLSTLDLNKLLRGDYSKIMARWIMEYWVQYKKAPVSSISEITRDKIADLYKKDRAVADNIQRVIKNIAERYGDNEETFDIPFQLDQAEKYLQGRSVELRREEEERLVNAGKFLEAAQLPNPIIDLHQVDDDDEPLFISDLSKIEIPERKVIVHPFLKESSMGNIYGEKGRGKTLFLHSLAHAITSDTEFGPWPIHNNVPCAIIDGELVMEEIFDRIKDITPTFESKHPLMLISNAYRVYQGKKPINLLDSKMQDWLLEKFLKYGIKVAFFDNLSCLAPGIDENAKKDYDPINQFRIKLKHNGIANDLVHHLGKTEKQRGTSGRDDNVDTIMILKKIPGYTPDMGARFNIEFDKARVKNDDLHLIREIEASYVKDPVGENVWAWDTKIIKNEKQYKRNLEFAKIAQFITDGITDQKVIANRLGCVQSTVSKKMSGMVFEGYLIKEGEVYSLTSSGEDLRDAFPS